MKKILIFLQGKKTTIGTLIGLTISLFALKGLIDNETAVYLQCCLVTLGLSANVATAKMYK